VAKPKSAVSRHAEGGKHRSPISTVVFLRPTANNWSCARGGRHLSLVSRAKKMSRCLLSVIVFLSYVAAAEVSAAAKERKIVVSGTTLTFAPSKQGNSIKVVSSIEKKLLSVVLPGGRSVTEFVVSSWLNGAGAVMVVEMTDANGDLRSYYWATIWLANKDNPWKQQQINSGRKLGVKAVGRIIGPTDDLEIGELSGPGDGVVVSLIDPGAIQGSDQRLAYFYSHRCAISGNLPGQLRRSYLSPEAVRAIRKRRDAR